MDSDHPRILLHKPRMSFGAIILGLRTQTSDLFFVSSFFFFFFSDPRIWCANRGSADLLRKPPRNHLGSRNQTSAIHGNNPRSIAQAKQLGHPPKRSHNRSRAQSNSTFCGKEATNDRTRKASRPSAATKHDRAVAHALQLCRQRWLTINK